MKHQILTATLAIFLIAGTAFAAGDVVINSGSVDFYGGGAGVLTVSGPEGFEYRQQLEAGRGSMSLFDAGGNHLADGTYNWQITLDGQAPEERSGKPVQGETFSGVFTVAGGAVADPQAAEGGLFKDHVIVDDLIVDGSACVGIDCTNGMNFGFDTLILKENNLRLKFEDTSTSASFPGNDWRLQANDSSNGGGNYFSIEDVDGGKTPFKVQAAAPSNALFVEASTGDIGLGTGTPVVELHVADGDSPTLRLEQDGSSGFTPQTWDIAGNETNFFVRDVTGGSKLPFKIKPGAPDNSLFVAADGDIGLGTDSPDSKLHVDAGSSAANIQLSGNNVGLLLEDDTTVAQHFINSDRYRIRGLSTGLSEVTPGISMSFTTDVIGLNCTDAVDGGSGGQVIIGDGDSCAGTWTAITAGSGVTNSSSRTLKENLVPVEVDSILDKISGVQLYNYDFIQGPKDRLGLMAEDFHQVFGRGSDKLIHSQEVEMALWLAVQELSAQNRELAEKLSGLETQLEAR